MDRQIVVNATPRPDKTNCVVVSVAHNKRRNKVAINYYPAEAGDNGRLIIHITEGHYTYGDDMSRLSNKRLDTLLTQVKSEIEAKSGPHYQTLLDAAKQFKMELS
jgi:hypothetical protein